MKIILNRGRVAVQTDGQPTLGAADYYEGLNIVSYFLLKKKLKHFVNINPAAPFLLLVMVYLMVTSCPKSSS